MTKHSGNVVRSLGTFFGQVALAFSRPCPQDKHASQQYQHEVRPYGSP